MPEVDRQINTNNVLFSLLTAEHFCTDTILDTCINCLLRQLATTKQLQQQQQLTTEKGLNALPFCFQM